MIVRFDESHVAVEQLWFLRYCDILYRLFCLGFDNGGLL